MYLTDRHGWHINPANGTGPIRAANWRAYRIPDTYATSIRMLHGSLCLTTLKARVARVLRMGVYSYVVVIMELWCGMYVILFERRMI